MKHKQINRPIRYILMGHNSLDFGKNLTYGVFCYIQEKSGYDVSSVVAFIHYLENTKEVL